MTLFRLSLILMLACCLQAAQVDPSHQIEYQQELAQGDTALQERDYTAAQSHYARANDLARGKSIDALRGMAWASLRSDDAEAALKSARAALPLATTDPERGAVHNLLGAILFSQYLDATKELDKLRSAEDEFRRAIGLDPKLASAYYNLGKALMRESKDEEAKQTLKDYLDLAPDAPNAAQVKQLIGNPLLSRGELPPNFVLHDTMGQAISPESLHGRVVLLDFWATWCGPCISSLPEIRKLSKRFPADKFALIGIDEDEDGDAWQKFIQKESLEWPQCRDENWALFHSFGLAPERKIVVPGYVILDRDGIVQQKALGLLDASSLTKQIEAALAASR
jgi:tetratricopeptide (TPR) repeat protein